MSEAGQSNIHGIDLQIWAGLALSLQFIKSPGFHEIHLESPKLQDFDVVYKDGEKYICEVKNWAKNFANKDLTDIFDELKNKKISLGPKDTLLVIAPKISERLKKKVKSARQFRGNLDPKILDLHGMSTEEWKKFGATEFWQTDLSRSEDICYGLVAQLIDAYVSKEDLAAIINDLLIKEFVSGSASGKVITKEYLLKRIAIFREKLRERAGHSALPLEKQLRAAQQAATDPNHSLWRDADFTAASINFSELLLAVKSLENQNNLDLSKWDKVLLGLLDTRLTHSVVSILKNNLNAGNATYVLSFLEAWIPRFRPFFSHNFHDTEILEVISLLCRDGHASTEKLLDLIATFMNALGKSSLFVEGRENSRYALENLGQCLNLIYDKALPSKQPLLIEFIRQKFNLIDDQGEYWEHSPPQIYRILYSYLISLITDNPENFLIGFRELTNHISEQFRHEFKERYRLRYKGWELWGSSSVWHGDNYKLLDRNIVRVTLSNALLSFYELHPLHAFNFAKDICQIPESKISANNPDFQRRGTISVIVREFLHNNCGQETIAFRTLSKLVKSKKSIYSIPEIIFQILQKAPEQKRDKVQKLLKVVVKDRYAIRNPFVFKTVVSLATEGSDWAVNTILKWLESEEFGDYIFGTSPIPLIQAIGKQNKTEAWEFFAKAITSKYFLEKTRSFDVYGWCDLLRELTSESSNEAINFIISLLGAHQLPENHQLLVFGTIGKLADDKEINTGLLERILTEIVVPLYQRMNWSQTTLSRYITIGYARSEIIDLCEALAKRGYELAPGTLVEVLKIIKCCATDPDPDFESKENDSELESGRMVGIQTVRGKCAWAIQHFLTLTFRDYLGEILIVIETLMNDRSYYIKRMSCFPFSILLDRRNRHADAVPIFGVEISKAKELRDKVEQLGYNFIVENYPSAPSGLLEGLAEIVNSLRLSPNRLAQQIWEVVEKFPNEIRAECMAFALFQAEFRLPTLQNIDSAQSPMLTEILEATDESEWFRKKLLKVMAEGSSEETAKLAWMVAKLLDRDEDQAAKPTDAEMNIYKEVTFRYLELLTNRYDNPTFVSIYMFLYDKFEEFPDECLRLYKKAVGKEFEAIKLLIQNEGDDIIPSIRWFPFCFNGKILSQISNINLNDALDISEMLLQYPVGITLGLDDKFVEVLKLKNEPRERLSKIFDLLVKHNPLRINDKDEWLGRFESVQQ